MNATRYVLLCIPFALCAGALWSCRPADKRQVVVYAALDQEFSEPVLKEFERQTGIAVRAVYDIESTKTVGLYQRILREKEQPLCDLFWNNEIMHTLQLEEQGLLEAYRPKEAGAFPETFVSPEGYWTGFAGRARVLLVNRQALGDEPLPRSVRDLADPHWEGRAGIARPLFGTTATHAAVLFSKWGDEEASRFFQQVAAHAAVFSGNKQVALAVSSGKIAFGLTDTDDAAIEIAKGGPVQIIWPDQDEQGIGTLLIPNTVAIVKSCRHPQEARLLAEFLLSSSTESLLAKADSRQIPLRKDASVWPSLPGVEKVRWMEVDFREAARLWPQIAPRLQEWFR
ncbi:MAG: iron transporter [Pirellulaceae bacterium]|nr:MAG: iron transporter [Pirellulaceae bacterium]